MIKKKSYTINEPKTVYGFITSDGYEFTSEREAKCHEADITPKRNIKINRVQMPIDSEDIILYQLSTEDDIDYLRTVNFDKEWSCNYEGPGWYVATVWPGGDYDDEYYLQKVNTYVDILSQSITKLQQFIT